MPFLNLKNTFSLIAFFFLFAASFELRAYNDSLLVEGEVGAIDGEVKNIVVNVYVNNTLFKSKSLSKSSKFKINLPLNEILTVEITAKNYHSKRFMIDSHVPQKPKQKLIYLFEVDLFSHKEMEGVNTFLLDFPVGLVKYDNKKGFVHDKKYTKQMKEEYFRLLEQAKKSEDAGLKSK